MYRAVVAVDAVDVCRAVAAVRWRRLIRNGTFRFESLETFLIWPDV